MYVTFDWTRAQHKRSGKKKRLSSDRGESGSKKYYKICVHAYGGAWRSPESGSRFCVGAFATNMISIAVKMFFTFNL
jgi:hypothetical protein